MSLTKISIISFSLSYLTELFTLTSQTHVNIHLVYSESNWCVQLKLKLLKYNTNILWLLWTPCYSSPLNLLFTCLQFEDSKNLYATPVEVALPSQVVFSMNVASLHFYYHLIVVEYTYVHSYSFHKSTHSNGSGQMTFAHGLFDGQFFSRFLAIVACPHWVPFIAGGSGKCFPSSLMSSRHPDNSEWDINQLIHFMYPFSLISRFYNLVENLF